VSLLRHSLEQKNLQAADSIVRRVVSANELLCGGNDLVAKQGHAQMGSSVQITPRNPKNLFFRQLP
jgi:hypothetical protein